MNEWMYGSMDELMNAWRGVWYRWNNEWVYWSMNWWMNRYIDGWTGGLMDV